jgi:hypothetical protein
MQCSGRIGDGFMYQRLRSTDVLRSPNRELVFDLRNAAQKGRRAARRSIASTSDPSKQKTN